MVGLDETMVLDCYRLAKYYSQSPQVFLDMSIGEVRLHLYRTIQLDDLMRRSAED